MAYKMLNRKQYNNSLQDWFKKHPLELPYEEGLINNYNSSELSDLFRLLQELKDSEIDPKYFEILKNKVSTLYSPQLAKRIFSVKLPKEVKNDTTKSTSYMHSQYCDALAEYIKDFFVSLATNKNKKQSVSNKEFTALSSIVNKFYPYTFVELAKNPPSNAEFKKQLDFIRNEITNSIDTYYKHSPQSSKDDIYYSGSSLHVVTKNLYKELSFKLPIRLLKSMSSYKKNLNKEIKNGLSNIVPSQPEKGSSIEDVEKNFSLLSTEEDIVGMTIVLDSVDDTLHFDKDDLKGSDLLELRKIRKSNIDFSHSMKNFLEDVDNLLDLTEEQYLQMKIDVLNRLVTTTYDKCSQEYEAKNTFIDSSAETVPTSFNKMLHYALAERENHIENKDFKKDLSLEDHTNYQTELLSLLNELDKRVHDKYQQQVLLLETLKVFDDDLLSEKMQIERVPNHSNIEIKSAQKKNGYVANYLILYTKDGRRIELQLQSKARFEIAKRGQADHGKMKPMDISPFFEPTSPDISEKAFCESVKILSDTPIAERNHLLGSLSQKLTLEERTKKKRLLWAKNNVQLKRVYREEVADPYSESNESKYTSYTLEQYLPIYAEYFAPELIFISSAHSRTNENITYRKDNSFVESFREILLKQDTTSCLSEMLISELDTILKNREQQLNSKVINTLNCVNALNIPPELLDMLNHSIENCGNEEYKDTWENAIKLLTDLSNTEFSSKEINSVGVAKKEQASKYIDRSDIIKYAEKRNSGQGNNEIGR